MILEHLSMIDVITKYSNKIDNILEISCSDSKMMELYNTFKCNCISIINDCDEINNIRNIIHETDSDKELYTLKCNPLDFIKDFKKHIDFVYVTDYFGSHVEYSNLVDKIFDESFTDIVIIRVPGRLLAANDKVSSTKKRKSMRDIDFHIICTRE